MNNNVALSKCNCSSSCVRNGEQWCLHSVCSPMGHYLDAYMPPQLDQGLSLAFAEAPGTVRVRGLGSVQRAHNVVCLWIEEDRRV